MDEDINFNNAFLIQDLNFTQQANAKQEETLKPLLNALTEFITDIVIFIILCVLVGAFGTIANLINIIIYLRMGIFSTGSNLNLFSLAVADLGVSFTTFLHGVGFAVIVADIPNLPWDPFAIVYLVVGWPVMIFVIANRILTAYVALERCLCVVLPFHIRSMFTIKRSLFYIVIIYAYTVLSHVPIYIIHRLKFQNQEGTTNISKLVLTQTADREIVHAIVFYSNSFGVTMATVAIVFVCTAITSRKIKTSKEWRKSVTGLSGSRSSKVQAPPQNDSNNSKSNSAQVIDKLRSSAVDFKKNPAGNVKMSDETIDKETRLVKMITTISLVFLACYVPELLLVVMKAIEDEIRLTGAYYRLAKLVYGLTFVSGGVNSSVNILIYYRMSSRYRREFSVLLRFGDKKETSKT